MEKQVDFYEIYDYYYQPILQRTSFRIAFGIFILLLLGIIIFFVIRRILNKRKARLLLPWQWALNELKKLSLRNCQTKNDFKIFYFDLTLLLKEYLYKRYGWQTLDKTDEELIKYLEEKKFDTSLIEMLKKIMESALWIKFADEQALKIQAERDLNSVQYLVEKTRGDKECV